MILAVNSSVVSWARPRANSRTSGRCAWLGSVP